MKPFDLQTRGYSRPVLSKNTQETENEAVLDFSTFDEFLCSYFKSTFTIITKKREYKCKLYAVYSSKYIRDFLKENPEANSYKYDIEDENEEFENISKIFNFERVNITSININDLDKMIKELEITCLYETIDNFLNTYDQTNSEFDTEQKKIDEIEKIISLLYNINENNFQESKTEIIKYIYNKDESGLQEFCSFLIQFIKTEDNIKKQELVSDILIDLDKEMSTKETLKCFMPQFINQLLFVLGITKSTCSYAYILYKKGKISENDLFKSFRHIFRDSHLKAKRYIHPYIINEKDENIKSNETNKKLNTFQNNVYQKPEKDEDDITPIIYTNICFWFLPEIIQMKSLGHFNSRSTFGSFNSTETQDNFLPNKISCYIKVENYKYLNTFWPDKLNVYKQMRDNGEPLDELTKALRRDDVDKLQQILSMSKTDDQEKMIVPYNIFEEYIENWGTSFINYSAAYGSIKCFKYLLSKHHKIDDQTFRYSIYGGNIEIVKIVDHSINSLDNFFNSEKNELISLIILSIAKHKNDIFEWIISNVFFQKVTGYKAEILKTILKSAAKNSNAHSLIRIFRKGCDLFSDFNDLVTLASANGFYKIIRLICLLTKKENPELQYYKFEQGEDNCEFLIPSLFSENLSIFKLYTKFGLNKELYQYVVEYAISREYSSIIKYFFERFKFETSSFLPSFLLTCLSSALNIKKNDDIFYILFNNFQIIHKKIFDYQGLISSLLIKTTDLKKIKMTKEIIQLILSKNLMNDFSSTFAHAVANNSIDLCHYILDNNCYINYYNLAKHFNIIGDVDEETFSIFINNIPPLIKKLFIENNLNIAIEYKNVHLIKYLFDHNAQSELALIEAVKTNDIKIVELVLEYFDLKYINEKTQEGTALTIAAEVSNLEIVNKLLSIEGIDPSLVNSHNLTALMIALMKQEDEICKSILDFYGENLKDQIFQLNKAIKMLLLESRKKSDYYGKNYHDLKIDQKIVPILKRILEVENVNLNCCEGNYSILSFACKINERSLVEYLLKTNKVDVNLQDPHEGNTALIVSILNDNFDIAKILIEHENTDLNISNYKKETALTIAVSKENSDIIINIINSSKFEATKSRLNYAFYISSPKISKLLISTKTLDVNYLYRKTNDEYNLYKRPAKYEINPNDKNSFFSQSFLNDIQSTEISKLCTTKIINIASSNNEDEYETVDLIMKHPTFDKEKSLCKLALFKSAENKCRINIFKKLFALFNNDVNVINENGTSLLVSAVMNDNDELVELILNDPKFNCNKSLIVYAYYKSLNNSMLSQKLEKYMHVHSQSINFDYIFPDGSTIFTAIIEHSSNKPINISSDDDFEIKKFSSRKKDQNSSQSHYQINVSSAINSINFLCENGANPNQSNKQGKYPLEISMNSQDDSKNAISIALINTNKIDLNIKLNTNDNDNDTLYSNQYYIHIAAYLNDSSILERMLKEKSVDINIPDSDGNTPLMTSCKSGNENNIKLFFTRDDLDFLHRNNEGKDALMELNRNDNIKIEQTQNKKEYLNKLLEYAANPKPALKKKFNFSNINKSGFTFKSNSRFKSKFSFGLPGYNK